MNRVHQGRDRQVDRERPVQRSQQQAPRKFRQNQHRSQEDDEPRLEHRRPPLQRVWAEEPPREACEVARAAAGVESDVPAKRDDGVCGKTDDSTHSGAVPRSDCFGVHIHVSLSVEAMCLAQEGQGASLPSAETAHHEAVAFLRCTAVVRRAAGSRPARSTQSDGAAASLRADKKSASVKKKACFPGREQTETEVGGGFSEAGWGGSSALSF